MMELSYQGQNTQYIQPEKEQSSAIKDILINFLVPIVCVVLIFVCLVFVILPSNSDIQKANQDIKTKNQEIGRAHV